MSSLPIVDGDSFTRYSVLLSCTYEQVDAPITSLMLKFIFGKGMHSKPYKPKNEGTPDPGQLYVHLRMGDKIKNTSQKFRCWWKGSGCGLGWTCYSRKQIMLHHRPASPRRSLCSNVSTGLYISSFHVLNYTRVKNMMQALALEACLEVPLLQNSSMASALKSGSFCRCRRSRGRKHQRQPCCKP